MGDSGSWSLGATLAVIALITGQVLLLPLIGLVFVLETRLGHPPDRLLQADRRQAPLPDGAAAPPLRALGWDEEKITLRFWIVGASPASSGWPSSWPRCDGCVMSGRRPHRPRRARRSTASAPARSRGRPVAVLGLARSGIALARFLADPGARVTVYDGRPATALAERDRGARGPAGRPAPAGRTSTRPRRWADRRSCAPRRRSAGYPDHRAAPAGGARRAGGRGAAGGSGVPALVSEVDLFLRLCPAPTIGRDRHQGQDDHRVAHRGGPRGGPAPVVLGGNIGTPLVERLPELTPGPPRRARAVRAAAADALAGHERRGLHPRDLRPPRPPRLARRPTARSSAGSPSSSPGRRPGAQRRGPGRRARTPACGAAPAVVYRRERADARRASASSTAGSWRPASSGCRSPAAAPAADGPGGPDHAARRAPAARAAQRLQRRSPRSRSALLFGIAPTPSGARPRASPASSTGWSRSPSVDGVRYVNDSQGTQPDAVIAALRSFPRPSCSSPAAATRASTSPGWPGRRRARHGRRAHRRERTGAGGRFRGRRARRASSAAGDARGGASRGADARSPASSLARRRRPGAGRDRAAQPGRRQLRHVPRLRGPRPRLQGRPWRRSPRPGAPRRGA